MDIINRSRAQSARAYLRNQVILFGILDIILWGINLYETLMSQLPINFVICASGIFPIILLYGVAKEIRLMLWVFIGGVALVTVLNVKSFALNMFCIDVSNKLFSFFKLKWLKVSVCEVIVFKIGALFYFLIQIIVIYKYQSKLENHVANNVNTRISIPMCELNKHRK